MSSKKRKRGEKTYQVDSFPVINYISGSFTENLNSFVCLGVKEEEEEEEVVVVGGCWSFQLEVTRQYPSGYVRLFVVEEEVGARSGCARRCWYCQCIGWGRHLICKKRFHFVLSSKGTKPEISALEIALKGKVKREKTAKSTSLNTKETQARYLMHGLIHSNGYGHLIDINGSRGGSDSISGHQIFTLWDKLCTSLQVRQVSIIDESVKYNMELRLIHGIAYGHPWFTQRHYKVHHGAYGATPQTYESTLASLQSIPLHLLLSHFTPTSPELPVLVSRYQSISIQPLLTLSDLIRLILQLAHRLPNSSPTSFATDPTCRWSAKRVDMAAQVIVAALKKFGLRWVTRQEVRDAARAYVGDTGLLDYVLKSLGNCVVGNYIVRRLVNPVTKVLEYSLQDVGTVVPTRFCMSKAQVMRDLHYVYKCVLDGMSAVKVILDAKHLLKTYYSSEGSLPLLRENEVACKIKISNELKEECEIVKLDRCGATIGELKVKIERKLKETYFGLKNFKVVSIEGVDAKDDEVFDGNMTLAIGDFVGDVREDDVYEGNYKVVDCHCGAKSEDGEKMVLCDICEVWKHTKCAGLGDEECPALFLCKQCDSNIVALPSIQY